MQEVDPYTNLRGGALVSASGLTQSTISSWGLELGERRAEGHPRYTIVDVTAVLLMKQLRFADKEEAPRASYIVKEAQRHLPAIVARIRKESREPGERADKFAPPYLIVGGGRYGVNPNEGVKVHIVDSFDELVEVLRGAVASTLKTISMRAIVKSAMAALSRDDIQSDAQNG